MPKVGMELIRKAALVDAAIAEIGEAGTLDVTVNKIAKRAGVSSGLAHHYFGNKEQIFLASMRHIQTMFGRRVREELKAAETPRERLNAIIAASFDPEEFTPEVVAAWLIFYVQAQNSPKARRLLHVYTRRLHSNLVYNLRQITNLANAHLIASATGALIDGLYICQALQENPLDRYQTMGMVWDYLEIKLQNGGEPDQPEGAN